MKKNLIILSLVISIISAYPVLAGSEAVRRLMTAAGEESAVISWINNAGDAGKMELFDEENKRLAGSSVGAAAGVSVLNNNETNRIDISPNAANFVLLSGLEAGREYKYRLKVTSSAGEVEEFYIEVCALPKNDFAEGWRAETEGYSLTGYRLQASEAADGDMALELYSNQNETVLGVLSLYPDLNTNMKNGEKYLFGGRVKGRNSGGFSVNTGFERFESIDVKSGDWSDFFISFVSDGENLSLVFDKASEALYLDSLYLYKTNSYNQKIGDNLIKNPGFDGIEQIGLYKEPEKAINLFASGRDKMLNVSWTNPMRNDIRTIALYDEEGELVADSETNLSKAAGNANIVRVTGLANGRRYRYELVMEYESGEKIRQWCISNRLHDYAKTMWNGFPTTQAPYGWRESVSGSPRNKFAIQSDVVHTGRGALVVRHNAEAEPNNFSMLGADLKQELSADKKYRASFFVKSVNSGGSYSAGYAVKDGYRWGQRPDDSTDWTKVTLPDITGINQTFMFIFETPAEGIYIDDVTLFEVDENGNITGENLLINGDFEHEYGFFEDCTARLWGYIEECIKRNIAVDYELAQTMVLEDFTDYFQRDIESGIPENIMQYHSGKFYEFYENTKESLSEKLSGNKLDEFVPKYITSRVTIDGPSFLAKAKAGDKIYENRPVFFIGYVGWDKARKAVNIFNSCGINIIQTEIGPDSMVFPADNEKGYTVDVSKADEIVKTLERAEKYNMKVDLLISPHYMPDFIYELEPEAKIENSGFIKYDVTNDRIRELLFDYFNALIPLVKDSEALNSICLTNEPAFSSVAASHIDKIRDMWIEYLQSKYQTISEYNKIYSKSYVDFSEVSMPMKLSGDTYVVNDTDDGLYNDYISFNNSVMTGFHKFLADTIKNIAPDIPLHCKFQNYFWALDARGAGNCREITYRGNDYEMLAEFLDINGNDAISQFWPTYWNRDYEKSLLYDLQRSVKDAPVFNSEEHLQFDGNKTVGEEVQKQAYTDLWQGAVHGRSASALWVYDRSQDESKGDMYMNVLSRPDVMSMVSRASLDLNRLAEEVSALQKEKPDIAILYSKNSRNLNITVMSTIYAVYQYAVNSGLKVCFVTEDTISGIHEYPLLVIPNAVAVEDRTVDEIYNYVVSGNKVLLLGTNNTLYYDENEKPADTSSERYEKYLKIKEKSDIILTQYTGPSIVSENGISAKFKRDVSEYFLNSDIQRIRLVNAEDESPCSDVEWEDAVYNGETLINAVNYDWRSGVKNVKVYNGDKNECYLIDLISGERFFGEVPLYTHQPRLLKAVDKPDGIEEEQTVFIEDGIRTDDPSGKTVTVVKRVKNNTGTGTGLTLAAAVYKDGRLMGLSAAEKTIPPSGFADGFEEIRLEMEFPLMKDGYSYKIMCWKDNMNPISKAEQRMGA